MADRGRQRVRDSRIVGAELDTVHGAPLSNTFSGACRCRLPRRSPVGPVGRLQSRDARTAGAHSASAQQRQSLISAHGLFLPGAGRPRIFAPAESPPPVSKGREGRLGSGERGSATQDLLESVAGAAVLAGRRGATPLASQE